MGKPLSKRFYGNPVDATGTHIVLTADIGAGAETCWIEKQTGSHRFNVASVAGGATPTRHGTVSLVNGAPALNQGRISVTPFGGGPVEYARSIYTHIVRTFASNEYRYSRIVAPSQTGDALIQLG